MRRHIELAFESLSLPLPPHPFETVSMLATATLLDQTELVACLPTGVARYFTSLGAIAVLPVKLPARLTPFCLVTLKESFKSPVVEYLKATIRKVTVGNG